MLQKIFFYILFLFSFFSSYSQEKIDSDLYKSTWSATWIAPANTPLNEYGVYLFRKSINLNTKPKAFVIHISADNRYTLFVNGAYAGIGPQRSDLGHWRYETLDISSYLKAGNNTIAVQVWNQGPHLAWAQMTKQTGLLVQGNNAFSSIINTNSSWRVSQDSSYKPIINKHHTVVGPNDHFNAAIHLWGWEKPQFNDSSWQNAIISEKAIPFASAETSDRKLLPRNIPLLEEKNQRFASIRRAEGLKMDEGFIKGGKPLIIPPNTVVKLVLDQGTITNAYPQLTVSGGKGSKISITYAEAMIDSAGRKGHRNEITGKRVAGFYDEYIADGAEKRQWTTTWFRAFRYVEMKIETREEPLKIEKFTSLFSAYPFKEVGSFKSDNPQLTQIWNTGWRTARLCAHETYMDCPYYEHLQYVGDTRIQALISLYVSGDDRLMRNAISQFNDSRTAEGLTQSRYPSSRKQIITPFSLFWICMVHDYWMYRKDDAYVKSFLPVIRDVLAWHKKQLQENNLLGKMPYWSFVDWSKGWNGGVPAGAKDGTSSILSLQYVYTLNKAEQLFKAYGLSQEGESYGITGRQVNAAVYNLCWDKSKGMISDTPEKKAFSQHANVMAVLADALPKQDEAPLLKKVLSDTSLTQCTIYYRFYMNQAFKKAGLGDMYVDMLDPWQDMLNVGLTTFAEQPEPTRSDCHAWSASPNYDLLATVCGIEPASPGFERVIIEPRLGKLDRAEGKVPHPYGNISVKFKRKGEGISAEITLPKGLAGDFMWNDKKTPLRTGYQEIEI
jgi:hypothetical protein